MRRFTSVYVLLLVMALFLFPMVKAVVPFGATVTAGGNGNETAPADAAGSHAAIAGNVSEIILTGFSTTQSWQGYYGNVSGTIQLADSTDNVLYNWSLASPEGEVYSSRNASVTWTTMHCFNYTARGSGGAELGQAGGYSLTGLNLTTLETNYNFVSDDVDGVNETFTLIGAGTHDLFYTNNLQFSEGECRNTRVFGDSGAGVSDEFELVLLFDSTTQSVVFASILDENVLGFDNSPHDFEMLVLEDGHGVDTSTTTYYFYVELE